MNNFRWWQLMLLPPVLTFGASALSIANGEFNNVGFPAPMVQMQMVANALEALGWLAVFVLAARGAGGLAARLGYFLTGMYVFDIITTWPLPMPLPPGFLYWGSATAVILLLLSRSLDKHSIQGSHS